jgi:hypothetical protein
MTDTSIRSKGRFDRSMEYFRDDQQNSLSMIVSFETILTSLFTFYYAKTSDEL